MNEEKIKELFSNEEYVKGLFELGSYEKASEKLAEDGVEISPEELKKAIELARKKANGELSDEELEQISGGVIVLSTFLSALFVVSAVGIAGGGAVFAGLELKKEINRRNC